MNDEMLILLIKAGDQKAFGQLYEKFRVEFIRWIMKEFRCPEDDTKDIYQVAVLVVYENIQKGKLDQMMSSLKTYLFGVGKNLGHEWNRKSQRNIPFEPDHFIQKIVVEEAETGMESKLDLVAACLKKIGEPCAQLLEQFYFNHHSMEEITMSMGYKNADTTKNQKYKCMGRLRKLYEEDFAKQPT